jgi:hypothetical protein
MIVTIAGTPVAGATTITARAQRSTRFKTSTRKAKGGAWRLPLSLLYCVVSEAR